MAVGTPAQQRKLAASDPVMAALMERLGKLTMKHRRRGRPKGDAYAALLRAVVGQQLSAKAAFTIHGRVLELYGGRNPTPQELLATDEKALRGAGLSGRKVEYLRSLAEHVLDGSLEIDRLDELSDEDVIAEIVAVRGLGEWSAQMFLMFFLERRDVLPTGDLGIRRAIQLEYGLEELPDPEEMERIAEPWRPYRTLACVYLWESLANVPV
jgi:DNA-3-methyladenine glycosylase II